MSETLDLAEKMGFGTFYLLVSSSLQADGIGIGSLLEGAPTSWAALLKI